MRTTELLWQMQAVICGEVSLFVQAFRVNCIFVVKSPPQLESRVVEYLKVALVIEVLTNELF